MQNETVHLLEQLIEEMRGMRMELKSIRSDVALMANEHRDSRNMQSPLVGKDLFHEDENAPSAFSRAR